MSGEEEERTGRNNRQEKYGTFYFQLYWAKTRKMLVDMIQPEVIGISFFQAIMYEGQDKNPEMCRVLLTHEIMCRYPFTFCIHKFKFGSREKENVIFRNLPKEP